MKAYLIKNCLVCFEVYKPTGPASKYCNTCAAKSKAACLKKASLAHQAKKGVHLGIGSGGRNAKGEEDSQYKNGITFFLKSRRLVKATVRYCERCQKDLLNVSFGEWAVHHKDHDRTNNVRENFELLCKRCHQLEHECSENLTKG